MFPPDDEPMPEDPMMAAPLQGGSAMAGLRAHMDEYVGLPEIDDILGLGQEGDAEMFADSPPMPLSSFYGGDEGVYGAGPGGGMSAGGGMEAGDDDAAEGIRDLLNERSKSRLAASEAFQEKAGSMR